MMPCLFIYATEPEFMISPYFGSQLHLRHARRLPGQVPSIPRMHRGYVYGDRLAPLTDPRGWQAKHHRRRALADVWTGRE